jgi:endonuclease YncB( thermonuclease family)
MLKPTRLLITLFFLTIVAYSHADDVIIGKVVAVADGDTITVLENLKQYKIRLFGIDTPEGRQDFGNKAKQLTSDLVFGKEVRVVEMDIDQYGRIVGMVYVGNECVNETLVEEGLAWVYRKYCIISVCDT